ncbi:hypothetical protein AAFF_G00136870 [Aldrovandia affinis]|uniref:Uncharacterized protein n=1 Tax=Aldrovandia affinis TaxID=143900 RepID=A0AAD7TCX8_9TELE|nr:hypothetical protein AAFF_G00136870 [Aldrovandia affinis]
MLLASEVRERGWDRSERRGERRGTPCSAPSDEERGVPSLPYDPALDRGSNELFSGALDSIRPPPKHGLNWNLAEGRAARSLKRNGATPTSPPLRSEHFKPCRDKDLAYCLNEGECFVIETLTGSHKNCRGSSWGRHTSSALRAAVRRNLFPESGLDLWVAHRQAACWPHDQPTAKTCQNGTGRGRLATAARQLLCISEPAPGRTEDTDAVLMAADRGA